MRIFDVGNPAEPVEVDYYWDDGRRFFSPIDIALAGRLAFTADWGLRVIEFLGTGIEEPPDERPSFASHGPTVVRGVLMLSGLGTRSELPERNSVMSRGPVMSPDSLGLAALAVVVSDVHRRSLPVLPPGHRAA